MKTKSELCLECLKCCREIGWYVNSRDLHMIHFYGTRGCEMFDDGNGSVLVTMPAVCKQLTDKGCGVYKDRPLVCRTYDGRNDPKLKGECLWNLL